VVVRFGQFLPATEIHSVSSAPHLGRSKPTIRNMWTDFGRCLDDTLTKV